MTAQESNGGLFLWLMFVFWVVAELFLIAISVATHGAGELVFGGVRLGLTLGLMFAVIRGKTWARWLYVGLLVLTLIITGFLFLQQQNLIMVWLIAYLVVLLYALLFSPSVKAYLQARNQARLVGPPCAARNDGPSTQVGNSRAGEGPPLGK